MLTPFPTQLSGYPWLSARRFALLADEPRVGKTGTTIMALDDCFDDKVLVVTTASGRPVWRRAFKQWSTFARPNVRIVGWGELNGEKYWKIANSWNKGWGMDGYFLLAGN